MRPLDCPFCEHQNPGGAKYCNDCGSPLHLIPCDQCGAVNNLTDTHCWRCSGPLLPPQPLARPGQSEPASGPPERQLADLERSGTSELEPLELEQELAAIEQETRRFAQVSRPAERRGRSREETGGLLAPDAPPLLDEVVAHRRPPRLQRSLGPGPRRPGATRLFDGPRAERYEPWRGVIGVASVVVFVAAIVGGGYLYYRLGAAPTPKASVPPPPEPRAEAPIEPRVARDVSPAPEPVPAPAVAPATARVDAPVAPPVVRDTEKAPAAEPARVGAGAANVITELVKSTPAPEVEPARVGGDAANIITQIGKGTAAPESSCPAAVAALALCDWVAKANRQ